MTKQPNWKEWFCKKCHQAFATENQEDFPHCPYCAELETSIPVLEGEEDD